MAKIKHTKNELKAQRDALKRYERYLPTLQLKKQQLQLEVRQVEARVEAKRGEEQDLRRALETWVHLYSEPVAWERYLRVRAVREGQGNVAGVAIPLFDGIEFERTTPDHFETPAWVDDGIKMLEQLIQLRIERRILEEQYRLLAEELRTNNQRVNLFEKVKIPEAEEHIRVIRIFLGDQQTAAVVRSKIAKGKMAEKESAS